MSLPSGLPRCPDAGNTVRLLEMTHPAGSELSPHTMPRFVVFATAVAASIVAVVTVVGSILPDAPSSGEMSASPAVLVVGVTGLVAITMSTWATVWDHPQASTGLALIATGLLLPRWAAFEWLPPDVRAGVLAAVPIAVAGTAAVALRWPVDGPPSGLLRAVGVLTLGAVVVHLVGYDPFEDPGCAQICVDLRPVAANVLATRSAVAWQTVLTETAAVVAVVAVWRKRPPRVPAAIVGGALVTLALLVSWIGLRWANWNQQSSTRRPATLLLACAAALVGIPVLVEAVRTRRTRVAVNGLVARLSQPETTWDDQHGPIRTVHFAIPSEDRWVDAHGQPVTDVPAPNVAVVISDQSGSVFRFVVAPRHNTADLLSGITPATRLALHNAQLSAITRARLADVQASRRRIVAMADTERQRIERDVHDGAQQRLVSAAFHLSVARNQLPTPTDPLGHAEDLLHDALAQLRQLTHGLFPRVLATDGLRAALEDLAGDSDSAVTLEVRGDDDIADNVAMAAYATVAAALDQATRTSVAGDVHISIVRREDSLNVSVTTTGETGTTDVSDFTDLADRIGALGAQLLVTSTATQTTLTTVLPCVSS